MLAASGMLRPTPIADIIGLIRNLFSGAAFETIDAVLKIVGLFLGEDDEFSPDF